MLALILAATVALASLIFFFSAFFAPKLHRQDDFFWSGVGLFYALVLWVCAQRLTGGVLLGQLAAVALILGFAWQTLKLRSALANSAVPLESPGFSFLGWLQGGRRQATKVGAPTPAPAVVEPVVPAAPEPAEIPPAPTVEVNVPETPSAVVAETIAVEPIVPEEAKPPEPVPTSNPEPAPIKAKGKPWQGLFGKKSPAKTEPLDSEDWDEPEPSAVSVEVAAEILEELEELENLGAEALDSSEAVTVIESVVQIVEAPAPEPEPLTAPSETPTESP